MKATGVRERVLDVASRLFYQQGYNLTGINQIIKEADTAKASLYHHFPSKADLLKAYLEQTEQRFFNELDAVLETYTSPEEKLWALFDYRLNRQIRLNFGGCAFIKITNEASREDDVVFAIATRKKERFKKYIRNFLTQIRPDNQNGLSLDELVDTFFLLLEGATSMSTIYKEQDALANAKKIAQKLL